MKTAVVLAGHHEATGNRYQSIVKELRNQGWENVVLYKPNWQTTNVEQLVGDFIAQLPDDREPLTLLGFSLGAMIALITAGSIPVENLILCSPSGYFLEYEPLLDKDDRVWADEHLKDFRNFSAADILNKLAVNRGVIIVGQVELEQWPDFRKWVGDLKTYTNWQYIELRGISHEIEASIYQRAIKDVIYTMA